MREVGRKEGRRQGISPQRRRVAGEQDELGLARADGLERRLVAQSVLRSEARLRYGVRQRTRFHTTCDSPPPRPPCNPANLAALHDERKLLVQTLSGLLDLLHRRHVDWVAARWCKV